jgi:2-succinyl-6-hydroxy-2,4-cyclohexadiene-1-carboxylate synthase
MRDDDVPRLRLHVREHGAGAAVVLLHGFTGSAAAWDTLIDRLAARFHVLAVDLPGHGASPAAARVEHGRLPRIADALVACLADRSLSQAAFVGYSLGGRVALQLALAHPSYVRRLVLESASPGIADPSERRARAAADAALADAIVRDGLERFVDRWLAQPLFASQRRLPAELRARERARRLCGSVAGYAWALRAMSIGEQESLWPRLGELRSPLLLLAGDEDVKYCSIARAMAAAVGDARTALVHGAGHAVHLERPDAWLAAVEPFLSDAVPTWRSGATQANGGPP